MPSEQRFSLNPIQQAAVEHPINAPLKVIAGAGTGKTMVLTHRFVHILKEHPDCSAEYSGTYIHQQSCRGDEGADYRSGKGDGHCSS